MTWLRDDVDTVRGFRERTRGRWSACDERHPSDGLEVVESRYTTEVKHLRCMGRDIRVGFHRVDANNDVLADACRPLDQRVRSKGNSACIGWRLIPKVERLQPPASVAKKLIPPN